jgi:hypothetical protein
LIVKSRPPPKIHDPPACMYGTCTSSAPYVMNAHSKLIINDHYYRDPEYSRDQYIQS